MAVDALFPQYPERRPDSTGDRSRYFDPVSRLAGQSRVVRILQRVKFLPGAIRVVPQHLHVVSGERPEPVQLFESGGVDRPVTVPDAHFPFCVRSRDHRQTGFWQAGPQQRLPHRVQVFSAHLQRDTGFFIEQESRQVVILHLDIQAATAGKRHFAQGNKCAAVGTVMVRQDITGFVQQLHAVETGRQQVRVVQVGRGKAGLLRHLRQRAAAQAVFPQAQVDEQQHGILYTPQLG